MHIFLNPYESVCTGDRVAVAAFRYVLCRVSSVLNQSNDYVHTFQIELQIIRVNVTISLFAVK